MVQRVYGLGLRRFEVVAEVPVNVLWTDDYLSLCIVLGRSIPTAICTESWHDVLGPRLAQTLKSFARHTPSPESGILSKFT